MQRATHHHLLTMTRPGKVFSFGCEARSRYAAHRIPAIKPPDQDTAFPPPHRRSTRPSPEPQLPAPQVPSFHFHVSPLMVFYHQRLPLPTQQQPHNTTSTSPRYTTRSGVNRQHSHPRPISPHRATLPAL